MSTVYGITATYYRNDTCTTDKDICDYVNGHRYVFDIFKNLEDAKKEGMKILSSHIKNMTEGITLPEDITFEYLQELAMESEPCEYPNSIVHWVCELDILERKLI